MSSLLATNLALILPVIVVSYHPPRANMRLPLASSTIYASKRAPSSLADVAQTAVHLCALSSPSLRLTTPCTRPPTHTLPPVPHPHQRPPLPYGQTSAHSPPRPPVT
ncbi:hypothetical protein L226DRAFT_396450 [Lentinus tigrinus ALCF2SS1-7]|uniref:uncharacterized protein n=1 Tax=Lentinus tigrinus ALCF2SS1-7 TaxID=1328758 RepID=UPI001165D17C|nr:hypothetical protein L226DRAFT_396450 [Lentinus tigrinus ALCF2SS1-7]